MPKLNLDIFGSGEPVRSTNRTDKAKTDGQAHHEELMMKPDSQTVPKERTPIVGGNVKSPRFIPVGFDQECLQLLDDAVLALRRQGYWKASKSGIIRALIKLHRSDLVGVLPGQALTTTSAGGITENVSSISKN